MSKKKNTRGLPPPAPDNKDKSKVREMRREKAITELINTEKTYFDLLSLLIQWYVKPLSDYKLITSDQHTSLFPQLQTIRGLSEKFLSELTKRRQNWDNKQSKLSDLFESFTPFFKMYQGYVNNHEKAVNLLRKLELNKKWVDYTLVVRKNCNGFDLSSLLILPIQRIPRYKLLLAEIIKNTQEDHPDYGAMNKALKEVEKVSHQINNNMKEFERRETVKDIERKFSDNIQLLSPSRHFIRQGKLWKVCRSKDRLYEFFLFNDLLIYASQQGKTYNLHNQLPINMAFSIQEIKDHKYGKEKMGRLFLIASEKKSFAVYSDTEEDAKKWISDLNNTKEKEMKKAHKQHNKNDSVDAVAIWIPDSHQNNCKLCNAKFSFVTRRHHCRKCGGLVCGNCSKWKLPNGDGVKQRACKTCYYNISDQVNKTLNNNDKSETKDADDDSDDEEDDYQEEQETLHMIPFYIDTDDFDLETIFNKFGRGVGSYVIVNTETGVTDGYFAVKLAVYTQIGFEQFEIQLFKKKDTMMYRLSNKKKKDFTDIKSLLNYLEKKNNLLFSYAIPRSDITKALQSKGHQWQTTTNMTNINVSQSISPKYSNKKGINNDQLSEYPKAKALFDYEAEVLGDLTLKKGDIIYILDKEDEEGWWSGQIGNRQGLFPSTYVKLLDDKKIPKKIKKNEPDEGEILIARFDYNEGGQEELKFNVGDQIILQAKDESGWWLGKLQKTGVVGWFAPDLVVPQSQASTINNGTSSTSPKSSNNSNNNSSVTKKNNVKASNVKKVTNSTKTNGKTGKINKVTSPKKKNNNNNKKKNENISIDNSIVLTVQDIKNKKYPNNVDKSQLELYLSDEEFLKTFGKTKGEWTKLQTWQKKQFKKKAGLF